MRRDFLYCFGLKISYAIICQPELVEGVSKRKICIGFRKLSLTAFQTDTCRIFYSRHH